MHDPSHFAPDYPSQLSFAIISLGMYWCIIVIFKIIIRPSYFYNGNLKPGKTFLCWNSVLYGGLNIDITVMSHERVSVSNYQPFDCLSSCFLFQTYIKYQASLSLAISEWNPSVTGGFPHKRLVRRTAFSCHDIIMKIHKATTLHTYHRMNIIITGRVNFMFTPPSYRLICNPVQQTHSWINTET